MGDGRRSVASSSSERAGADGWAVGIGPDAGGMLAGRVPGLEGGEPLRHVAVLAGYPLGESDYRIAFPDRSAEFDPGATKGSPMNIHATAAAHQ